MPAKILHIVDGESTGGTLRVSRLAKERDILRWKDALYIGPVPAGLSLTQLSKLRSRFWTAGKRTDEFVQRDAQLRTWKQYDEIVLWFGSTSLCQLSLAQVLTWFGKQTIRNRRISLVTAYGGTLRPEQLASPFEARRTIAGETLQLAIRFWGAFTSPTPNPLQEMLRSNLRSLPHLREAINQLLQEYPGRDDGLSCLERRLLLEIRSMGSATAAFTVGSIIRREWVGDTLLFDMLRRFVSAPCSLLAFADPFTSRLNSWQFNSAKLRLTDIGERVLDGKEDHVHLNGIDRWIGGVHLLGRNVKWRWDEKKGRVGHGR